MPFDGILTNSIAEELNQRLLGGRIGGFTKSLVMLLSFKSELLENHRLLLSCNPSSARIHLTERQYENPSTPPLFCSSLRKHFSGGIIKGLLLMVLSESLLLKSMLLMN